MPLLPGTSIGPYEVTSPLGSGGMGEVYRARDRKLGRDVAIKILPPAFAGDAERIGRFDREARTLAALNHPNIAQIYGLETQPLALIMELVEGEDLARRMARGPIPLAEAVTIARQIAEALEAAHESGIIHRDLKPANVKIRDDGTVKVLDFGLAKSFGPAATSESPDETGAATMTSPAMTAMGLIIGTAAYMAPEQAKGRPADRRADVWAFGVVLYEMLSGTRAFDAPDVSETLAAVLTRDPHWNELPASTPDAIRRLLARCLAKDRRLRLDSMAAVRLDLDDAMARPATAQGAAPRPPGTATLARLWPAALVVVGIVAGALFTRALWPASSAPSDAGVPLVASITAAPGAASAFTHGFALSPDGATLVYSARTSDGKRQLWKRLLADARADIIPDTEGGTYPFWSPDGENVAFFTANEIKRVRLAGGPAQVIAHVAAPWPEGSWGHTDEILFSLGNAAPGVFKVSASGGSPEPLNLEGFVFKPQWLPDGRHFLYVRVEGASAGLFAATGDGSAPPVHVMDFDNVVLGSDPDSRYSANGFLLFNHAGVLSIQAFDATRLKTDGPIVPIGDHAGTPRGWLAASVAGRTVIALNPPVSANGGTPGDPISRLQWVDRSGRVTGQLGPIGRYWTLRLSHDGLRAAVNSNETISVIDSRTDFTTPVVLGSGAAWMPDDSSIVYKDWKNETLSVKSIGEGQPRLIVRFGKRFFRAEDVSPDGLWILASGRESADSRHEDLFLISVADGSVKPFATSEADAMHACFSPNGRWIAYEWKGTGRSEVWVRPFQGGGNPIQLSADGGEHPMWPRNSHEVFFLSPTDEVVSVDVADLERTRQPGARRVLFRVVMNDIIRDFMPPYAVAPNGDRFLLNVPDAPEPLTLMKNVGVRR